MDKRFVSGIEDNTRKSMVELLNARLADLVDLTLVVKQAHWTLKGPGYIGVHELLDEVAARTSESADTIAERVMILGGQADGTVQTVSKNSNVKAYPADLSDVDKHVQELTERFSEIGKSIRESIAQAGEAGDEDTADLFTEVSRQIDKDAWFIGANNKS